MRLRIHLITVAFIVLVLSFFSCSYNPADYLPKQSLLFRLSRPLVDLQNMLMIKFAGKTISMLEIYQQHNVDTPYIKKNYKEALKVLEKEGKIITKKPKGKKRREGTFADSVLASFPDMND